MALRLFGGTVGQHEQAVRHDRARSAERQVRAREAIENELPTIIAAIATANGGHEEQDERSYQVVRLEKHGSRILG